MAHPDIPREGLHSSSSNGLGYSQGNLGSKIQAWPAGVRAWLAPPLAIVPLDLPDESEALRHRRLRSPAGIRLGNPARRGKGRAQGTYRFPTSRADQTLASVL